VPERIRALRGAITLDHDSREEVLERTKDLLGELLERNGVQKTDIVSIVLTATEDVRSEFPAAAGRLMGLGDVPLLCAREMAVEGGMPLCIRVLMTVYSDRPAQQLRHVFLRRASSLPTDLPR
jgi:chorismate mutase